jgi:hypothetical protein
MSYRVAERVAKTAAVRGNDNRILTLLAST